MLEQRGPVADESRLDCIAEAFALVIDAKSPWTYRHSNGVAELSVAMAGVLRVPSSDVRELRRAALLHDLGKLGVSNLILDKPGKLTEDEFAVMRRHPEHTYQILRRVGCFSHLADVSASHHERLDGRGYHRQLPASKLPIAACVLAASDICDALRSSRPYRAGLPVDQVLDILRRETGAGIHPACFEAVREVLTAGETVPRDEPPAVELVPTLRENYHQAA